jgi:hypothetical protein
METYWSNSSDGRPDANQYSVIRDRSTLVKVIRKVTPVVENTTAIMAK